MKLKDLKIGEQFRIGKGKTIWIKQTEQGLNNAYSYCMSLDFKKTRNPSQKKRWEKLFSQNIDIIKINHA